MTSHPLTRPEFSTAQFLSCVPGLTLQGFNTWIYRGVFVPLDGDQVERGKRQLFSARDVIQAATLHEVSRLTLSVAKVALVQYAVQGRLIARQEPPPGEAFNVSAAFCADPATGELVMRFFREGAEKADPLGLDDPDAPDALVVLRMDRLIARVLRRLDALRAGLAQPPEPNPAPPPPRSGKKGFSAPMSGQRPGGDLAVGAHSNQYRICRSPSPDL
jgi:hypothetical protein